MAIDSTHAAHPRLYVIVNPNAGKQRLQKLWDSDVLPFLRAHLPPFDFGFTEGRGHASDLALLALQRGYTDIITLGGDGTLNEAVNGFFRADIGVRDTSVLSSLPFGSGGDFARTLGLPRKWRKAVQAWSRTRPRLLDVGRIVFEAPELSPRYFLNIANAGVVARVMQAVNGMSRAWPSCLRYLRGTLAGFRDFHPTPVKLSWDDGTTTAVQLTNLVVANGQYFGSGMRPARTARPDSGTFEIVVLKDARLWHFMGILPRLYGSPFPKHSRHVEVRKAFSLRVELLDQKSSLLYEMDGEPYGHGNAHFEILPQALNFRVPPTFA